MGHDLTMKLHEEHKPLCAGMCIVSRREADRRGRKTLRVAPDCAR
jgi:hypothetical protein